MKLLYFGYGAYISKSKTEQIIGHPRANEIGGILEGYRLAYQNLSQIPQGPREDIAEIWGETFKAYTLIKQTGIVSGVIFTITEEDLARIKEWEFVGIWRDIVEVDVKTSDGFVVKAITDIAKSEQEVEGYVDGLHYNEFAFTNLAEKGERDNYEYYTQQQLEKIRANLASLK